LGGYLTYIINVIIFYENTKPIVSNSSVLSICFAKPHLTIPNARMWRIFGSADLFALNLGHVFLHCLLSKHDMSTRLALPSAQTTTTTAATRRLWPSRGGAYSGSWSYPCPGLSISQSVMSRTTCPFICGMVDRTISSAKFYAILYKL
jgi:hypothetical protein